MQVHIFHFFIMYCGQDDDFTGTCIQGFLKWNMKTIACLAQWCNYVSCVFGTLIFVYVVVGVWRLWRDGALKFLCVWVRFWRTGCYFWCVFGTMNLRGGACFAHLLKCDRSGARLVRWKRSGWARLWRVYVEPRDPERHNPDFPDLDVNRVKVPEFKGSRVWARSLVRAAKISILNLRVGHCDPRSVLDHTSSKCWLMSAQYVLYLFAVECTVCV